MGPMSGRVATRLLAALIAFAASLAAPVGPAEQSAGLGKAQICAIVWLSERTRKQLFRRQRRAPRSRRSCPSAASHYRPLTSTRVLWDNLFQRPPPSYSFS